MKIYDRNKMEETEESSTEKDSKENLIKIKEIPVLQAFYEQIICTMSESNRLSLEALNLVEELSSRIKGKVKKNCKTCVHCTALKSFSL